MSIFSDRIYTEFKKLKNYVDDRVGYVEEALDEVYLPERKEIYSNLARDLRAIHESLYDRMNGCFKKISKQSARASNEENIPPDPNGQVFSFIESLYGEVNNRFRVAQALEKALKPVNFAPLRPSRRILSARSLSPTPN